MCGGQLLAAAFFKQQNHNVFQMIGRKGDKSMSKKQRSFCIGLLIIYLTALVWIILLKMQFSFENLGRMRNINLIPFAGSVIANGKLYVSEIIYNIFILLPFSYIIYHFTECT